MEASSSLGRRIWPQLAIPSMAPFGPDRGAPDLMLTRGQIRSSQARSVDVCCQHPQEGWPRTVGRSDKVNPSSCELLGKRTFCSIQLHAPPSRLLALDLSGRLMDCTPEVPVRYFCLPPRLNNTRDYKHLNYASSIPSLSGCGRGQLFQTAGCRPCPKRPGIII